MESPHFSADHSALRISEQFCASGSHNRRNCVSVLAVVTATALQNMPVSNSPRHLLRRLRDVNIKMSKSWLIQSDLWIFKPCNTFRQRFVSISVLLTRWQHWESRIYTVIVSRDEDENVSLQNCRPCLCRTTDCTSAELQTVSLQNCRPCLCRTADCLSAELQTVSLQNCRPCLCRTADCASAELQTVSLQNCRQCLCRTADLSSAELKTVSLQN